MTTLDEALAAHPATPDTARSTASVRRCGRHRWDRAALDGTVRWPARCRNCTLVTEDPDAYFHPRDWDGETLPLDRQCLASPDLVHELDRRPRCIRCGAIRDDARSRRGRSSARLGKDQERRIERVYGPRKVGELGDAIDLLGRDFAWQSKASRSRIPDWMAAVHEPVAHNLPAMEAGAVAAMVPILGTRYPLVIRSWVRHGVPTIDRIWVRADHWRLLHGTGEVQGWTVMSGDHFLAIHGRDEEDPRS